MRISILIICLLSNFLLYAEGFVANTLIKTPQGFIEIDQIRPQDTVICYEFTHLK